MLLLEAGPRDANPWIHVPLGYGKLFATPSVNWMYQPEPEPELNGRSVFTPRGIECWGANTDLDGFEPRRLAGRATVRLTCPRLRLAPGEYEVDVAIHARDGAAYDYRRRFFRFTVRSSERGAGIYFPEHRWEARGDVEWRPPEDAARRGD